LLAGNYVPHFEYFMMTSKNGIFDEKSNDPGRSLATIEHPIRFSERLQLF